MFSARLGQPDPSIMRRLTFWLIDVRGLSNSEGLSSGSEGVGPGAGRSGLGPVNKSEGLEGWAGQGPIDNSWRPGWHSPAGPGGSGPKSSYLMCLICVSLDEDVFI